MKRFENGNRDYTGETKGILTCIKHIKDKMFLWRCDCGKEIEVESYKIHWRKSCGCLVQKQNLKRAYKSRSYDTVTISQEYTNHRGNAKVAGRGYMKKQDWLKIVKQPCFYCGEIDIRNRAAMDSYKKLRGATLKEEDIEKYAVELNGVDRLDSNNGYEMDNVVPCCGMCNRMKNKFTYKEFIDKIKLIYLKHN